MAVRFRKWRERNGSILDLHLLDHKIRAAAASSTLPPIVTTGLLEIAPEPLPFPSTEETISPGGEHPSQPTIIDFHFADLHQGQRPVVDRFPLDHVIHDQGPKELMKISHNSVDPDLRWVHLPFNSMVFAEDAIRMICKDLDLEPQVASKKILSEEKWGDWLHVMSNGDAWHHSTFMFPNCHEITVDEDLVLEGDPKCFCHAGANMAIFMPYIHWGTEDVLQACNRAIEQMPSAKQNGTRSPVPTLNSNSIATSSSVKGFYYDMMQKQLFADHPMHLRRTLHQFYYVHAPNTDERDLNQIVARYGPDRGKKGSRNILLVDQLWLWIIGGKVVVTCFDRRWTEDESPRADVFDNVLWKLQKAGQGRRIKSAYELAHLITDECSSYFFSYSNSLLPELRFSQLFRKAISTVNERQSECYQKLVALNQKPISKLSSSQQSELFDAHREFILGREIKEIIEELLMIRKVYDEQLKLLEPLCDLQLKDFHFRRGDTDADGNCVKLLREREPSEREEGTEREFPEGWDERDWYRRTSKYMEVHRAEVEDMIDEAKHIYEDLRDTINLKQNSANIYEAHESRREAETVLVFTLVSSFMLPLSFFTSIFSLSVHEINSDSDITLARAMTYIIPLSLAVTGFFVLLALRAKIRGKILEFNRYRDTDEDDGAWSPLSRRNTGASDRSGMDSHLYRRARKRPWFALWGRQPEERIESYEL